MTRARTQQAVLDSLSHFDWDEHNRRMDELSGRLKASVDTWQAVEAAIDQANRDLIRDLGEQFRRMG